MRIYLIRHCESEDDILDCYGGCADFELTNKGIKTAKLYSDNIKKLGIEKIFSSPYKRAKGVASIFNEKLNCGIEIINDLREINTYGVMSGVNKKLAKEIFSILLNSNEYKNFGYYNGKTFEGGESIENFDNRVKNAFSIIVNSSYNKVAIVTHGGVFRSVYKNILRQNDKILEIEDVATIEIEYNNGEYSIISMKGIELENNL